MEIKGKIISILPLVTGQGKNGQWQKLEFILETPGQYPKKVCMNIWGQEAIDKYDLQVGLEITAHVNIESREYQGRWFTEIKAWKITWDEQAARKWQNGNQAKPEPSLSESSRASEHSPSGNDDLPF